MVSEALAAIVLKPAAIVVIAVLIVALVLTVVLSVLIKRRGAVQSAAPRSTAPPQRDPVRRAIVPAAPVDMQERLRRLTTIYDSADETTGHVTSPAHGSGPLAPRGTGSLAAPPPPVGLAVPPIVAAASGPEAGLDDATRFFGDSDAEAEPDSTTFFGAEEELPDATTFFGAESEPGASAVSAEDDGTRFFGLDDDGSLVPAQDEADAAPSGTQFFGLDAAEHEPAPSETHFFTPDELDSGAEDADAALEGHTGMLRALPPTLKDEVWDDKGRPAHGQEQQDTHETEHEEHDLMASTGFLAALPPSTPVVAAAVRDLMRERLASISAPEVLALSVIDGTGRVLAGEGDENLAGELYALMDESGQGKAADIEQPVRLADDSAGVILLLPTGTDALLGALVREAEDPRAMRDSLRGLAHEIGDAMRRAS